LNAAKWLSNSGHGTHSTAEREFDITLCTTAKNRKKCYTFATHSHSHNVNIATE